VLTARCGIVRARGGAARLVAHVEDEALGAGEALAPAQRADRVVTGHARDLVAPGVEGVATVRRHREGAGPRRLHPPEIGREFALRRRADRDRLARGRHLRLRRAGGKGEQGGDGRNAGQEECPDRPCVGPSVSAERPRRQGANMLSPLSMDQASWALASYGTSDPPIPDGTRSDYSTSIPS
jgi:hypothetical protein